MPSISPQTKSFIILFTLCIFGVFVSLLLWPDLLYLPNQGGTTIYNYEFVALKRHPNNELVENINTSDWKTYTNTQNGLSFKIKPDWKVLAPIKKRGYTIIQVDPGKKYYNIKIYINPKEFYIMGGLPTEPETIGGAPALNVYDALFGIKTNNLYYTFDVGLSMSLVPEFDAMVHSVEFSQ